MVLIAKTEPGGALNHVWESAGEEGAIEVDEFTAYHLLQVPEEMFFLVSPKEVSKQESETEEPKPKVASKAKPKVKETPEVVADELGQALNEANGAR